MGQASAKSQIFANINVLMQKTAFFITKITTPII